jgi:hypothetical protein
MINEEGARGLRRREFLGWLCKIGGGATALTLGPAMLPLRRVNTVLFGGTAYAQQPCTDDVCTTRDICETGDAGHTCQVQDVCDVDESGDCTGDKCTADRSGVCTSDECISDSSYDCQTDLCTSDSSGSCTNDRCKSDSSGPCTNDGGPACPEDETCPEDTVGCPDDYGGLCGSDSSGACTQDGCTADSSGECQTDLCTADSSGTCANDKCISDSSGGCTQSDTCVSDSSGECQTDLCTADSAGICAHDTCVSDSSGECQQSDNCTSDSSGGCTQSDICTADSSGDCTQSDTCTSDSSGLCATDKCISDASGDCTQSDTCHSDQSGACTSRDRCNSDYSWGCVLDVCVLDTSHSCNNDLCREDRSPSDCTGRDTCALDLALHSTVSRRNFARAAVNQAVKALYHMAAAVLFVVLACGPSEAQTVINAANAVFSDTPTYVTAGSVSVPSPVGPFLRDCDGDGVLEADTNGDGQCGGDPEVRDHDGDGSRELPEGTSFAGHFQFTCFCIPSDVAIAATGPLTIAASREAAVFGAMRLASGIQLSCSAMIDLRTSTWLSEDGSEIRFATALTGGIDETQNAYSAEEGVPPIAFTSVCDNVNQAIPTLSEWGMIILFLILAGFTIRQMRKERTARTQHPHDSGL